MVMTDIYTYDQQKVGFFYNDSNDCKKEMNLDESKRHIVFYNGLNSIPYHFTMEDDHITHDHLMFSLNTSIVKGTPRWSQRSYSALFNFWMNGIVFMMEEGALHEAELPKDDWRAALMAKVTEWTQENDSLFLPIVGHLDLNDQNRVPPLAEILGISKEDDLPHIYLIHPLTGQVAVYPEKLDDVNNYSPELIIAWAQMEVINLELENLEAQIQYAEEAEADEEGKDLYKPSEEEKKHMKEAQEHH